MGVFWVILWLLVAILHHQYFVGVRITRRTVKGNVEATKVMDDELQEIMQLDDAEVKEGSEDTVRISGDAAEVKEGSEDSSPQGIGGGRISGACAGWYQLPPT